MRTLGESNSRAFEVKERIISIQQDNETESVLLLRPKARRCTEIFDFEMADLKADLLMMQTASLSSSSPLISRPEKKEEREHRRAHGVHRHLNTVRFLASKAHRFPR